MLHAHFHQQLDSDAVEAVGQRVEAHHFREVFAVDSGGVARIGHGDEKAHAEFVAGFAGLKKDAATGDAGGAAQILEMLFLWIRWADAHQLIDFATAAAAAFCLGSAPENG